MTELNLPHPVFIPATPPPGQPLPTTRLSSLSRLTHALLLPPFFTGAENLFVFSLTFVPSPSLLSMCIQPRSARAGGRVGGAGGQAAVQRRGACSPASQRRTHARLLHH